MKNLILGCSVIAILLIVTNGCGVDVPLSFSKTVPDERLCGYWKVDAKSYYSVKKTTGGCTLELYELDDKTKKYKASGAPEPLYFTTLTDKNGSINFVTQGSEGSYITSKYVFNSNNELIVSSISDS